MDWRRDDSVDKTVEEFKPFNMQEGIDIEMIRKIARALVTAKSEDSKRHFQNMLKQFKIRMDLLKLKTDEPFIEVPAFRNGQLFLGHYLQGGLTFHECRLQIDELIQTAINAAPNKGKTNLLFHIICQIQEFNSKVEPSNRVCVIVLDRKQDFRGLPIDAAVLGLEDLRINLFASPPGYDQGRWISDISNTLMHTWGLMFASRNYFQKKVYDVWNDKKRPPTMYEVYQAVKNDKESMHRQTNRQLEIEEVNLDRIETVMREFGRCFATTRTFQLDEFIESAVPLVIEADVSPDSFGLLLSWLLQFLHKTNKALDRRGNIGAYGNSTVIVCDEAYILWETARDYSESRKELGANFVSLAPLYIRDFRMALIAASQRPLSPDYMSASNLRAVGWTGDYKDMTYYANNLGVPEMKDVIPKLGVGQYLVKVGDRNPALVKVPYVAARRRTDAEIEEEMKPYRDAILQYCSEPEEPKKEERVFERLSEATKALLGNVCDFSDATISFRYERLGWNTSAAQDNVREAVKTGYLTVVEDTLDSQKKAKYLVPTQKGIEWLRSAGKDVRHIVHVGHTGPVHALYQNALVSRLRRLRHTVLHDHFVGEKLLDVYSETPDGKKVGFEIAVGEAIDPSKAASAIEALDEYHFLCRDLIVAEAIRREVGGPKVQFHMASDFLLSLKRTVLDNYTKNNKNSPNSPQRQDSDQNSHDQPNYRSSD